MLDSFVDKCSRIAIVLWCAYCGIKVKVLVLFFVSLSDFAFCNDDSIIWFVS